MSRTDRVYSSWPMWYFPCGMFCSLTLVLTDVRCACTECGCFLFGFVLSRYVAQVNTTTTTTATTTTTTTNTTTATTSSPKCVGSFVPDSLPSFLWTAVLPLDADACLEFSYCPLCAGVPTTGLLFLYFSVYLLRLVCLHFLLYIHFTHPLTDLRNLMSAKWIGCLLYSSFRPTFELHCWKNVFYLHAVIPNNCEV